MPKTDATMPSQAATEPADAFSEPLVIPGADWASDLALTILTDAFRFTTLDAAKIIAARLRLVRHEGRIEGTDKTATAILDGFRAQP